MLRVLKSSSEYVDFNGYGLFDVFTMYARHNALNLDVLVGFCIVVAHVISMNEFGIRVLDRVDLRFYVLHLIVYLECSAKGDALYIQLNLVVVLDDLIRSSVSNRIESHILRQIEQEA